MITRELHSWDVTPRQAIRIQERLRKQVLTGGRLPKVRYVAGADISWKGGVGYAGVIVFRFPDLEEIERVWAVGKPSFPYVPGLLSFREGPLLLKVFRKLRTEPDIIFFDGQGMAHPRRIGIASHMGLLLNKPTIGCAKSRLIGEYREPNGKTGGRALLRDQGETIGVVLRTKRRVSPIFVSIGHKISLRDAAHLTLKCSDGFRIPKPTRLADQYVDQLAFSDAKLS
ncbi:MAG: endonuclease V [Elusimicrobia bacterium]|nr:endonuclease V [Elusimicrobiota bacterium]